MRLWRRGRRREWVEGGWRSPREKEITGGKVDRVWVARETPWWQT
jgi:hypothetical protein